MPGSGELKGCPSTTIHIFFSPQEWEINSVIGLILWPFDSPIHGFSVEVHGRGDLATCVSSFGIIE